LSEEAAFTLASRSLLAEDPPPSMLLRVASGARPARAGCPAVRRVRRAC
jgi:hypothetical protein